MATVFGDWNSVLLIDFVNHGSTINASAYCDTVKRLRAAIKRIKPLSGRPNLLRKGILLLHDNARPQSAHQTQQHVNSFNLDVLNHPPYSPDLAQSDFHLFPKLTGHLGSKNFRMDSELKAVVEQCCRHLCRQVLQIFRRWQDPSFG
uniref:Histone-lysine N-methyltransferase SETMAR n=1 Tax=Lygus hesperus TaxID=30085 RepID=A0A0A9Y740_LYGHE